MRCGGGRNLYHIQDQPNRMKGDTHIYSIYLVFICKVRWCHLTEDSIKKVLKVLYEGILVYLHLCEERNYLAGIFLYLVDDNREIAVLKFTTNNSNRSEYSPLEIPHKEQQDQCNQGTENLLIQTDIYQVKSKAVSFSANQPCSLSISSARCYDLLHQKGLKSRRIKQKKTNQLSISESLKT